MERGASRPTSPKHGRDGRRKKPEDDRSLRSTDTGVSGPTGISGRPRRKPPLRLRSKTQTSLMPCPEEDRRLRTNQSLRTKTGVSGPRTPESPA